MVNQSNNDDSLEFESRTQKKHYAHSMVDLAHKLANLSQSQLNSLPIAEQILTAIADSKKISSNIAKKRHFQFIGKLLLKSNHQEIIDALETQNRQHEAGLLRTPFLNQWLEDVLADASIVQQLYETHEHSDIQTLRQLLRAVNKDNAETNKNSKKNRRKLFEHIRAMDNKQALL